MNKLLNAQNSLNKFIQEYPNEKEHCQIIQEALNELKCCRNELCLMCGKYKYEWETWCKECRWGKENGNK